MNLPEPSGSSPPEKPPGSITIWARRTACSSLAIVSSIAAAERLRTTRISVSAPAFSKARAVSYSQFVPGNTGMHTRGFAALMAGAFAFRSVQSGTSRSTGTSGALFGKTFSSGFIQAWIASPSASVWPPMRIACSSCVLPEHDSVQVLRQRSAVYQLDDEGAGLRRIERFRVEILKRKADVVAEATCAPRPRLRRPPSPRTRRRLRRSP